LQFRKNNTHQSVGLALAAFAVPQRSGRDRGISGHGAGTEFGRE
jgi:hypothetical protein